MKKLRIDLHNHTYLCNHASGTMQEYIQKAIEFGIDVFGFSCHAPMNFDPKYRMSFEDMIIYENEIFRLQEEFKDKIKILFAYEVDFLEGFIDDKVINKDVDYFIGSVHFIDKWGFDNPEFIGRYDDMDIDDIWQKYFDAISLMAKSGLFDIVGHLDLIKVFKFMPKKKISDIAYDTLKEIQRSKMTIEVNPAGIRKPIGEVYPSPEILKIANSLNIPITFGSDAHHIDQIGFGYEEALKATKVAGYKQARYFVKKEPIIIDI
ncbi:MAG: histidinol-phosphatase [Arcobacteraceae bacterium]|nr:histidinol-phosphatase [Arcobacteraceae bacterium]